MPLDSGYYPQRLPANKLPALFNRLVGALRLMNFFDRAVIEEVLGLPELRSAKSIVEVGSGTGAVAGQVLRLSPECRYVATEASERMARATAQRLAPFNDRALTALVDPSPLQPLADHVADFVLSMFVVDIMSLRGVQAFVEEAHRVLAPGGTLCVVVMWPGAASPSTRIWEFLYRVAPALTGGSRPIDILPFLSAPAWTGTRVRRVSRWGLESGIVTTHPVDRRYSATASRSRSNSRESGSI